MLNFCQYFFTKKRLEYVVLIHTNVGDGLFESVEGLEILVLTKLL